MNGVTYYWVPGKRRGETANASAKPAQRFIYYNRISIPTRVLHYFTVFKDRSFTSSSAPSVASSKAFMRGRALRIALVSSASAATFTTAE